MARRFDPVSPRLAAQGDLPVRERRLANGMKALVLPRRGSSVVVSDLYYPVGSFDEPTSRTGLAHFVEHMLFKGTERFPKGRIDNLVFAAAGQCNAETGEDATHYWFVLPADRWELALEIEADRMRGARFDPVEIELERRVIREERARELNSPQGRLDQNHLAVTYARHPYRNPILGWPEDLARIGTADLTRFYRRHYRPEGAVVVVVGDVDPGAALDRIEAAFGGLPPGARPRPARRRARAAEPSQSRRRDFTMAEADGTARGLLGWRTVPRGHADVPALDVLSDLLSCGRRSRLFQSLVERDELAYWVEAAHCVAQRGGQFLIQIEAEALADRAEIERRVQEEAGRLASEGPTASELERSRHRLEAAWRWESEDLTGLAAGLGHAALWGDWRDWPREHRAAMAVDADDVRRVASRYLREARLTAGWSAPGLAMGPEATAASAAAPRVSLERGPIAAIKSKSNFNVNPSTKNSFDINFDHAAAGGRSVSAAPAVPGGAPGAARAARLLDYRPRRVVLDNGMRLAFERRGGAGVVAIELYVDAGCVRELKPGLAALTGRLLEEGTEGRSADEIAEAIENVGGSIEVGATGGSAHARAEDLELALELLAEMVLRPAFPPRAIGRVARRIAGELRADLDDPAFRADLVFRKMIYGDHALGRDARGGARELARLTRADVVEHHRRHFVPEGAVLVVAGDFDPRRLRRLVDRRFGAWRARRRSRPPLPKVAAAAGRARRRRVVCPGEQAHVLLGHLGVERAHPDHDALVVLDHVLGSGPGFSDRLGRIVRDEMGLAYAIGGGMTDSADLLPGVFRVYAGTTPAEVERVIAVVTDQVRALRAGEFSDDEIERARAYVAGARIFDFQTVEQRAERLLEIERFQLPLNHPQTWPERISALSPARVRQAARDHLRPEALDRLVLGPRP